MLWYFDFFLCHYSPGRISYILITTFLSQLPLFLLICQFLFSDVWYVWLSSLLATPFAIFHVCIFIIRNVSTLGSCGASPVLLVWNQLMQHSLPATIATEVRIAKRCVNYYFVARSFDLHDVQMSRGFFQPLEKIKYPNSNHARVIGLFASTFDTYSILIVAFYSIQVHIMQQHITGFIRGHLNWSQSWCLKNENFKFIQVWKLEREKPTIHTSY